MVDERMASLEARVRDLESQAYSERRRSRLWRGWAVLAVITAVGSAALGRASAQEVPALPSIIEAREFRIRDASGRVLFHVGPAADGVVLTLRDQSGRVTARLPEMTMFPLVEGRR